MPVEQIEEPSIKYEVTSKFINFVKKNVKLNDLPESIKAFIKSNDKILVIKLGDINWMDGYLKNYRDKSNDKVYLHELLSGGRLILPEPKVTPRNPILEARVQKLQAQQDARDYEAMTKGVDSHRKNLPEDTLAYQMKEINRHLIAVAQFIFSVIAGFLFGYIGIEYGIGPQDFGFKLLLGIICALIVALAEIYFLAKKLNEEHSVPLRPAIYTKPHQE
ncbi:hypothetical protein HCN44_007865 [Aphidius gifuensis]|uniref:Uncharacterized protein n=1 Tax=Aphidius gifuensis TaxID=684658 RepID=A0A835CRJ0_APHGI|nr:transmembrane protein 199-like [Aphidius gifuensis]XP_044007674.1 transmembrane protein 199-like [Aphidius gifuensis]KAF7993362.1 hypothetical protein HCN44_007865 [Aphidius gifuensis]